MPFVFVHGVSNRASAPEYSENELARNASFRGLVFPGVGLDERTAIFNPYWGGDGVKFRWGNASLPERDSLTETFGTSAFAPETRAAAEVFGSSGVGTSGIADIARWSLSEAIEVVWVAALSAVDSEEQAAALVESYEKARSYACANPKPAWLVNASDGNFIDQLLFNASQAIADARPSTASEPQWESFGATEMLNRLRDGARGLTSLASSKVATVMTSLARKKVHMGVSLFIGDVFQYLTRRGSKDSPGPIVHKVLHDFRAARSLINADDPKLVIVGHSLGGVISYDILTHFDPTIEVAEFVTVGSQVALFEEMTLCKESQTGIPANPPSDRLKKPENVGRWLNIFDFNDIFGFRAEGVFDGVRDFAFETEKGLLKAHGGYFHRPGFYYRLGERLAES
ncbi:hypothetical protein M3I53_05450 [Paraburkholderia sp. CNPSo 3272]|uniref:hypothetical protein n=1 Tax=Paraburkholderia sp. CNPSo 3272 TaxID=2940931 RepID=UPI0020B7C75C|nr:hypothetical protein [Paraburkholderia sp. CNPSo 3272]MCP3722583.1 hypothetical protein [Paraburkholderia sp. CNPSo 3272]